jgi:hypothetical protein
MTVAQLIKRLKQLPANYVVMQESAPWGLMFPVSSAEVDKKYDKKTGSWVPSGKKLVLIEHGVGI